MEFDSKINEQLKWWAQNEMIRSPVSHSEISDGACMACLRHGDRQGWERAREREGKVIDGVTDY